MLGLQPRALVFDLDGLMIDSEPFWLQIEHAIAAEHGHTWTEAQFRSCVGTGLPNTARTLCRELALPVGEEAVLARLVDGFIARAGELVLKPGCRELVAAGAAAGLSLAVASSSQLRLIEAVLDAFALRPLFQVVVSGESVSRNKPAPDVFLRAAELLAVPPEACVVLEDSLPGVRAAVAAGIPVIAVPEVASDEIAALADFVAADLHEARRALGL